jgi:hypothetical protein
MHEDFTGTDSSLRRSYYRDHGILGHNCFLEESVEEDIEDCINSPLATFLRYAFPLVRKIWEKSIFGKHEFPRNINFPIIEEMDDRSRNKRLNKKTIGSEHPISYEVRDFHFYRGVGEDPMVRNLLPIYEK